MALTYSIVGGPDASKFNIDPATGDLSFKVAPDFENPGSAAGTNEYRVTVGATDPAAAMTTQDRVITVTDVNEAPPNQPPQFTSPANVSVPENQTAVDTVQAVDPDDPPPPSGEFPNASTTGPRIQLTNSGAVTTTQNGQVISGLRVSGNINVNHQNVVIRDCECHNVISHNGNGAGLLIEYTRITGQSHNSGISMTNGGGGIVRFCDISGCENGMWWESNNSQIVDNYFHDLQAPGNPDPHYDGVQIPNTSNVLIRGNNFDFGSGMNACVTTWGVNDIDVIQNRLKGGTYVLYWQHCSGCETRDNVFVAGNDGNPIPAFGWIYEDTVSNMSYSGNVDANGNQLTLP